MRWNDLPGRRFGPYEILEEIGRGGTSRVYRARNVSTGFEVAFKIIPNDADDRDAFIQRFIREMEIISRLKHPNIVRIYDAGETDEFVYLVMQLAMGVTLRQLAAAERMGAQVASQFMIQAARALHHAHLQGIVHRDVKPSNMLIPNENPALLLLTDFGTAKILGARGPTKTGATIGTPEYMSPEQAEGREVDQRSDIYSLGCTLYEALAGRPPFVGATPVSVLYQHVHAQPTYIRSYNGTVPRELWNVLRTCLSKRPEDRYGSAQRVAEELMPFAEGLVQPTPAPWPAPVTNRLGLDQNERPTNRQLRAQPSIPLDGGLQATPQMTPLPAPFTPAPAPIMPDQSAVPSAPRLSGYPVVEPRTPRATLRPQSGPGASLPPGGHTSGAPYSPARGPHSQPGPFGAPGNGAYGTAGPRSIPPASTYGPASGPRMSATSGPLRAPLSGPRARSTSGPLHAPTSGTGWSLADAGPVDGYRGPKSGPLRGAPSGPYRGPSSGPYRGAQSGPVRSPNSGYGVRATASGGRAGGRRAPATRPLRRRPPWGMLFGGFVASLLLGGALALGAAGMGLLPGAASVSRPTATPKPTATLDPTATATPAQPTATPTPSAQQLLDLQAAAAFKGITVAPFTDFSCSPNNQVTSLSASQPVFVNLCTARGSMPGPVTVVVRSGGAVVRTLYNHQYLASSSGYSQGHTLAPGTYDMLVTMTINGQTATAKDIPFTVQ